MKGPSLPDSGQRGHRRAQVFLHGQPVGTLVELATGFRFTYLSEWIASRGRSISVSLPVGPQVFESRRLFPFFQGLLSEGELRRLQLRQARLDEADILGLLLATCQQDAAGAVTVRPVPSET